ncbi:MAG: DUF3332 domain-containing protein [Candidatus Amulumruptor caecigallinarius]|nr:DUF3332 domain-containing protein [Candidatus Amulumruptor caecigallinarius]MCM1397086.1 DUF3332 domain-containing protein [Candidatus Amulumruptor caecigallinarius]MCM1454072.1 DUF3332 domain-containing protein [bacterium]
MRFLKGKRHLGRLALVMFTVGALTLPSCIGKFALTKKMLAWNNTVGSKFVNELVFFAFWILPVYEVSALADLLVINSIEFWSGNNPIDTAPRTVNTEAGPITVAPDSTGYTITTVNTGESVRLDYDDDARTWSVVTAGGEVHELLTFIDADHVALPGPAGTRTMVTLDDSGLLAYQATAMAAARCPLAFSTQR